VAGYAAVMETIFASWSVLTLTENHIKQVHGDLLRYSTKDMRHRGEYKKLDNHVVAFDAKGKSVGIVFQTASPFDTPCLMTQLVEWVSGCMSQDAQIRKQIEAAQTEIKRLKAGGKLSLGGHQEDDNSESHIKSLEAMVAEQQTRLKRLKQQSNQD
jgi:hypothetical protein